MAIDSLRTLTLRRFCGDEVFRISEATMMAWRNEDGGVNLNLEIKTELEPIQTQADTRELCANPGAEITLPIPAFNPDDLAGHAFDLPNSSNNDEDDFSARIYYCEHANVFSNRVEILKQVGNRFRIRWTGETCDVNYYDGSKPAATVEIDAVFTFSEYLKWKSTL